MNDGCITCIPPFEAALVHLYLWFHSYVCCSQLESATFRLSSFFTSIIPAGVDPIHQSISCSIFTSFVNKRYWNSSTWSSNPSPTQNGWSTLSAWGPQVGTWYMVYFPYILYIYLYTYWLQGMRINHLLYILSNSSTQNWPNNWRKIMSDANFRWQGDKESVVFLEDISWN